VRVEGGGQRKKLLGRGGGGYSPGRMGKWDGRKDTVRDSRNSTFLQKKGEEFIYHSFEWRRKKCNASKHERFNSEGIRTSTLRGLIGQREGS